jgi:hypothetical protein
VLSFKLFEAAYKVLKRKGLTASNIEWFANAIVLVPLNFQSFMSNKTFKISFRRGEYQNRIG